MCLWFDSLESLETEVGADRTVWRIFMSHTKIARLGLFFPTSQVNYGANAELQFEHDEGIRNW